MPGPDQNDDDKTQTHVILTKDTMVSHYRIIEKIGAGGMGEVYLAEDTELDRKVALKFLPSHLCQDEDCRTRFKREAQAVAKLSHPNVVTIYEVSEHHGRPFFAMELVEGQSLRELAKGTELGIDRIIELAIQVCDGLSAAHDKKIVHRDIKPSNIVIDNYSRPKILDFGLAAIQGSEHLTKTGSTLGTIGYMSPEQVQGKEIDHRSDLFSLGVVIYELLAKQNPFKRDSEAATLKAVIDDTPHPVARYRADVSDGLQAIIDKALEKDVKTRYQHADGMLSDLMRVKRSLDSGQSAVSVSSRMGRSSRAWWVAGALIVVATVIVLMLTKPWVPDTATDQPEKIMLAVLPFENLGLPEDEYFADGITEEILVNLSQLSGLGVISRSSASKYKGSDKSLKQIGKELDVDYVLLGTIRWDKSGDEKRLRINPRLVHVSTDINLWADRYTVVLDDIFAVQASVAQQVAAALGVTLLETEQKAVAQRPTENAEAYDYYLRGNQYYDATNAGLRNAEAMYQSAIELEPEFALAWAKLGMVHTQMYWYYHDRSPERLAAAKEAVDRSLAMAPDLAGARFALGWYYYHGERNYEAALKQFALVARKQPGNSDVLYATAQVQRRQGRWQEAVDNFTLVIQADPRNAWRASELAGTLISLREYANAERLLDQAIGLAPDLRFAFFQKALMCLVRDGHTASARQVIVSALETNDRWPSLTYLEIALDMVDGKYQQALDFLSGVGRSSVMSATDTAQYYLQKGDVFRLSGKQGSQAYYDSARTVIEQQVRFAPDDEYLHLFLGKAFAGMSRTEDAIREGKLAVELLPVSEDAFVGPDFVAGLAEIYAIVGEYDLAIDQLEYLLSIPSWTSESYIATWPEFTPLRDHPRFKALVESE